MTLPIYCDNKRMHHGIVVYTAKNCNPNGNPLDGNKPRITAGGYGLITAEAQKRRVRDRLYLMGSKIYIQRRELVALNNLHADAYKVCEIKSTGTKQHPADIIRVREQMCSEYDDIRLLGAVMSTEVNCGQVLGPVQVSVAESIEPIEINLIELQLGRVAITREKDLLEREKSSEMGKKWIVPFAVYVARITFTPHCAESTGCSSVDLERFWEALATCWETGQTSSKAGMAVEKLWVLSANSPLGSKGAPAHKLFKEFVIQRKEGVAVAHQFEDYQILNNFEDNPQMMKNLYPGVTYSSLID